MGSMIVYIRKSNTIPTLIHAHLWYVWSILAVGVDCHFIFAHSVVLWKMSIGHGPLTRSRGIRFQSDLYRLAVMKISNNAVGKRTTASPASKLFA